MGDVTFRESTGIPANQHAKRLAKESSKKKDVKPFKTFYTLIDSTKILLLTVKPSGLYRSYFGNAKKLGRDIVDVKIKGWKARGQWLEQGLIDEVTGPLILEMQSEQARR